MSYRVWYSTESFADYIIDKTILADREDVTKLKLVVSDAKDPKDFHKIPDHIKKILYLDAPDLIVEFNNEPIFSIEESKEAGTGHNSFQRFSRLVAAVENNVPSLYIYPEATTIPRKSKNNKQDRIGWDKINPLIFQALEEIMDIYDIPSLLFYFPTDFRDYEKNPIDSPNYKNKNKGTRQEKNIKYAKCPDSSDSEMGSLFSIINSFIEEIEKNGIQARNTFNKLRNVRDRRTWMRNEFTRKNGSLNWSPLTSSITLETEYLLNYLSQNDTKSYSVRKGELLSKRKQTIFYYVDAKFRKQGDPYTGCLAAIDYIKCRLGKSFEERDTNLVMVWGRVEVDEINKTISINSEKCSINDFISKAEYGERKSLLLKGFNNLKTEDIPRYYMQVRYGSTYSKSKVIRILSYFADAILFVDGSLWRDA